MMPRKSENVKLTMDDLDQFDRFASVPSQIPEVYRPVIAKFRLWVMDEVKRRVKAGKAGGRPKKIKTPLPSLVSLDQTVEVPQIYPEALEAFNALPDDFEEPLKYVPLED